MSAEFELLHDPDSMSTGTNGLIPPETGIFIGLDRAGRFTGPLPAPISTDSVSIEVSGELEKKERNEYPSICSPTTVVDDFGNVPA